MGPAGHRGLTPVGLKGTQGVRGDGTLPAAGRAAERQPPLTQRGAETLRDHQLRFPSALVYGDLDYAGLRVITCGGAFDTHTRSYESNIVIYASLIRPYR